MLAFIVMFLPALVMVVWRYYLFHEEFDLRKFILEYGIDVLLLNTLVIAIAYLFFGSDNNVAYLINNVASYALKYSLLSIVLALVLPLLFWRYRKDIETNLNAKLKNIESGRESKEKKDAEINKWSNKSFNKKTMVLYIGITIALICVLFGIGTLKKGYHVDEMFTFGLSNHQNSLNSSIHMDFQNGISYSGQELWEEYLTVKDGGSFDYSNVCENQIMDVHPPLYYFFIHTVSSLFPNMSLIWIGLIVNVLFDLIIYWQLVWISKKLGLNQILSLILSALFILSVGFIGYAVVFFRMYALLAVWVNFLIMLFLAYTPEDKSNWQYYLCFGLILLGGLMTQYYFIIFAFIACLVYAFFVIKDKNWSKLILSLTTAGVTAKIYLKIWPAALKHVFSSYRGTEAIDNLTSGSLADHLISYMKQINTGIFGGLFLLMLAILICLIIISLYRSPKKHSNTDFENVYRYALLIIPSCLYVVLIAKIAPYIHMRYVISVMAPLYIAFFVLIIKLANNISRKMNIAVIILAVLVLLGGYRNEISNLYPQESENIEIVSEYEDSSCIYIYSSKWRIIPNLQELKEFDDIVFMQETDYEEIIDIQSNQGDCENLIVYVDNTITLEAEDALSYIIEAYNFSESTELFTFWYTTCYVLN